MTPDTKQQPALFPPPPPLALQLRERRRQLVDAFAVSLAMGEPLSPSAVQPLAVVQAAIEAVEAELGIEQ